VAEVRQRPDTSRRLIQNIEVQLTGLAGLDLPMSDFYLVVGLILLMIVPRLVYVLTLLSFH